MTYETSLEEIIHHYVNNRPSTQSLVSTLLKPTDGNRLVKEIRAVSKAFEEYINALNFREQYNLDTYLVPSLNEEGVGVISDSSRRAGGVYVYNVTQKSYTVAEFKAIIQPLLPEWVTIVVEGRRIHFGTDLTGTIRRSALENFRNKHGNIEVNSSGKIVNGWVAEAYDRAKILSSTERELIRQAFSSRMRTEEPRKEAKPIRSGGGSLSEHLNRIRKDMRSSDIFVSTLDVAPHGVVSSRTWGIEVESGGSQGATAPAGWIAKGDGSLRSAYTKEWWDKEQLRLSGYDIPVFDEAAALASFDPTVPLTEEEGSCGSEECTLCQSEEHKRSVLLINAKAAFDAANPLPAGLSSWDSRSTRDDCREFVSPILHSFHSKGLEKLVGHLNTQPQNDSSGVHVHVGVKDLTPRQIGSLVYGYNMIEPLLESSYKRNKREYCKERSADSVRQIGKETKTLKSIEQIPAGERYVTLNLNSINTHGTVEFRAMGPVYDYEYLIRWAYLCRELVNAAKNDAQPKDWNNIKSFADIKAFMVKFGNETVDNALSEITEADMQIARERNGSRTATSVYELVGGEI